ncbi:MAG: hypothetical protein ACREMB_15985 [Candidatus Rokuibacteriota bacterium]
MIVRDLQCWPPKWQLASSGPGDAATGAHGILIAARWDLKIQALTLVMEDDGQRYSAVLRDDVPMLKKLSLLLDWHVGRPLAKIAGLEMTA